MLKPRVKTNISRKLDCFPCVHLEFWPRTWWTVMEPFFCFKMIESFGMISQQTSWLNLNFRCEEILLSNDLLNKRLFKQGQFSIKSVPHVCFFFNVEGLHHPGNIPRVFFQDQSGFVLKKVERWGEMLIQHILLTQWCKHLFRYSIVLVWWCRTFFSWTCLRAYRYTDIAKVIERLFFSKFWQHLRKYSETSGREPPTWANSTLCWWNKIYQDSLFNSFPFWWER